ncbi:THAP domain-containing protein 2-like [Palaemon carinicauda]|uniref:THAP domain-containing protein 2-like n=1 Tax=Palaemon carinicauda TaxID=392227 RepID=UPI0035B62DFB
MPNNCAVFGCFSTRTKNPDLIFHSFPKDSETREKWAHLCKRADHINVENALICNRHFEADVYERNLMYELLDKPVPRNQMKMKKGSVPTLHMPTTEHDEVDLGSRLVRAERRGQKRLVCELLAEESNLGGMKCAQEVESVPSEEEMKIAIELLKKERDEIKQMWGKNQWMIEREE